MAAYRPALIGIVLLMLSFLPTNALDLEELPTTAPHNPEFLEYLDAGSAERWMLHTGSGYSSGLIPSPIDLSHLKDLYAKTRDTALSLPPQFDLRSEGRLTSVGNQGNCGSCWSFATYGSLESCLMPGESTNWSENHLKNTHGFDAECCDGGNHFMSTAYLARWSGPVYESSDPYNPYTCTSPMGLAPEKHVQQVIIVRDRAGSLDNDAIKLAVMTYGAVYTSMYWGDSNYNPGTTSYYYNGGWYSNHAVCIVGWDDNYPAAGFNNTPGGNGAFIVRNSWGPGWGSQGYFYVSYYDSKIGKDNAVFPAAESVTNYDGIYEYDPLGWVTSLGYGNERAWFANIFTAQAYDELAAVGFYAASPGSSYEIRIYLNPTSGPIKPGNPTLSLTGMTEHAGYVTIPLSSFVPVSPGTRFSVVIKLTTPGYQYPVPCETRESGYSSYARANAGESYISSNGTSWNDLSSFSAYADANVCLKAFTRAKEGLSVSPRTGLDSIGRAEDGFTPDGITYILTNAGSSSLNWTVSQTQDWVSISSTSGILPPGENTAVSVWINSNANSLPVGDYYDTVVFANTTSGQGNTTRAIHLKVTGNYMRRPVQFGWVNPSGHTLLALGDDAVSSARAIPFPFSFYGQPYSSLYVGSNGLISFANTGVASAWQNMDIPSTVAPNAALYPFWDDLDPSSGGNIYIGTVGSTPNRRLVVTWLGVPPYNYPSGTLSFQAMLCEGTNDIIFQYLQVHPQDVYYGAGRSATIGIENEDGTIAAKYSYNGSTLLADGQAILFTLYNSMSITDVKVLADGVPVEVSGAIISAASNDVFYIQSDDRSTGIRVEKVGHGLSKGTRANVNGWIRTNTMGERYIEAQTVNSSGNGIARPIFLIGSRVGGSGRGYDPVTGAGQRGIKNGVGLNNIGLLVSIVGKVVQTGNGFFRIDDGSGAAAPSGETGILVSSPGLSIPQLGRYVKATGASSCVSEGGDIYPRVLVFGDEDISILD